MEGEREREKGRVKGGSERDKRKMSRGEERIMIGKKAWGWGRGWGRREEMSYKDLHTCSYTYIHALHTHIHMHSSLKKPTHSHILPPPSQRHTQISYDSHTSSHLHICIYIYTHLYRQTLS